MREAAATVREAGLEPFMASAIADRQAWVAALAASGTFAKAPTDNDWRNFADRILRVDPDGRRRDSAAAVPPRGIAENSNHAAKRNNAFGVSQSTRRRSPAAGRSRSTCFSNTP